MCVLSHFRHVRLWPRDWTLKNQCNTIKALHSLIIQLMSYSDEQMNVFTRYLMLNISQFMCLWNSFRLISCNCWIYNCLLFFFLKPSEFDLTYKLTSAMLSKNKDTQWDMHKSRHTYGQTETIVFCLRFKMSLWPLSFPLVWNSNLPKVKASGKVDYVSRIW